MELLDAIANQAAVHFKLRLARTAQADAALLAFKVGPAAYQARGQMFELARVRPATDLRRERARWAKISRIRPVRSSTRQPTAFFEIALLRRRERVIEEHDVDMLGGDARTNLLGLALARERGGIRLITTADHGTADVGTR